MKIPNVSRPRPTTGLILKNSDSLFNYIVVNDESYGRKFWRTIMVKKEKQLDPAAFQGMEGTLELFYSIDEASQKARLSCYSVDGGAIKNLDLLKDIMLDSSYLLDFSLTPVEIVKQFQELVPDECIIEENYSNVFAILALLITEEFYSEA